MYSMETVSDVHATLAAADIKGIKGWQRNCNITSIYKISRLNDCINGHLPLCDQRRTWPSFDGRALGQGHAHGGPTPGRGPPDAGSGCLCGQRCGCTRGTCESSLWGVSARNPGYGTGFGGDGATASAYINKWCKLQCLQLLIRYYSHSNEQVTSSVNTRSLI